GPGRAMPGACGGPPGTIKAASGTSPGGRTSTVLIVPPPASRHPSAIPSAIVLVLPNIDSYTTTIFIVVSLVTSAWTNQPGSPGRPQMCCADFQARPAGSPAAAPW